MLRPRGSASLRAGSPISGSPGRPSRDDNMNVAIFGGTFDPIHVGHLRAARVAARSFNLDRVLFVPSGNPPHKRKGHLTDFVHRYAMVALACAGVPEFMPSLLEAPHADGRVQYSVDTARAVRKRLNSRDSLYFLIGLDAFLDLPHWKDPQQLLDLANFIVVSRPGFQLQEILRVLPTRLVDSDRAGQVNGTVRLRHTTLRILPGVRAAVSSSDIREDIRAGRSVTSLLHPLVEEYILKHQFYRPYRLKTRRGSRK
jgi:nicotinate-nucleotide adenylyltransferase